MITKPPTQTKTPRKHNILVVVESPAKARTLQKYLGKDYQVLASYGHVRDLIPKEGAVDTEHDFKMHYQEIERNGRHIDAIQRTLTRCQTIYLATDPDREGEAIAWHIIAILEQRKALENKEVVRVAFHEITQTAIQQAIQNPRAISMDLVNAQQARRALDYLVGFTLSPLLWKKIRTGLSAGRVQSPALRMIVERDKEIEDFVRREFWTVHAQIKKEETTFTSQLIQYAGKKVEQFTITQEEQSKEIIEIISQAASGKLTVDKVIQKKRKRYPAAPFTTSTLQQEASRKLGFSAQRSMQIAQQLYEGVDVGSGPVGLITYMRTDSVTLSQAALTEIRDCIATQHGKENLPKTARHYKTKTKNAQEAHEAIRPTSVLRSPEDIRAALSPEQYKLYQLIWKRTIASQMIEATFHTVAVDLAAADHIFRATGSTLVNPGFIKVYQDKQGAEAPDPVILPPLEEGQVVELLQLEGKQHFTEPPPRYTEASLIKTLEEYGIGRPSTYASIISTLKNREYVTLEKRNFRATDVGIVVNRFLTRYFTQYVDYHFTAKLEDDLDAVSRGDCAWVPLLKTFWTPFKERVQDTSEHVKRSDVTQEMMEEHCPKCNKMLSIRLGRRGRFIGCTGYPDCDYTRNLHTDADTEADTDASAPETVPDRSCPKCQSPLIIKQGRYGKFIGCSGYPQCRHIEPLEKPKDMGVLCPLCKKGNLLQRKSRRGKLFYSCGRYPQCSYAIWNKPLQEACPQCHWPILSIKETKRSGVEKVCPQKNCNFSEPYSKGELNHD